MQSVLNLQEGRVAGLILPGCPCRLIRSLLCLGDIYQALAMCGQALLNALVQTAEFCEVRGVRGGLHLFPLGDFN